MEKYKAVSPIPTKVDTMVESMDGRIILDADMLPMDALTPTIAVGRSWTEVALITKNIAEEYSACSLLSSN